MSAHSRLAAYSRGPVYRSVGTPRLFSLVLQSQQHRRPSRFSSKRLESLQWDHFLLHKAGHQAKCLRSIHREAVAPAKATMQWQVFCQRVLAQLAISSEDQAPHHQRQVVRMVLPLLWGVARCDPVLRAFWRHHLLVVAVLLSFQAVLAVPGVPAIQVTVCLLAHRLRLRLHLPDVVVLMTRSGRQTPLQYQVKRRSQILSRGATLVLIRWMHLLLCGQVISRRQQ